MLAKFSLRPRHILWLFLTAITLFRVLAALKLPLGVDEAHYVLYGRWLDWSYFDHPSLIGWVQHLMIQLPLPELLRARVAPLFLSVLTSLLLWNYLQKMRLSEAHAAWAVATLNLTPMYNALSVAFLPDTLLMPLTVLVVSKTEDLLTESNLKNWLLLGLYLGLSGLSKYTAVLFIAALAVIFLQQKKLYELLNWRLWLGALLALLCVSPVLYWNLQNDFASFQYQAGHVLSFNIDLIKNIFTTYAVQIVVWGLGPGLIAFFYYFRLLKKKNKNLQQSTQLSFLSVFLLFFTYAALSKVLLPHWLLVFFVLAIPLALSAETIQKIPRLFLVVGVSALLSLTLLAEAAFRVLPASWTVGLYRDLTGWEELMDTANAKASELGLNSLAVMNWTLGSRAIYYSRTAKTVFVVDSRQDQFDLWTGFPVSGTDLLVLVEAEKKAQQLERLACANLRPVGEKSFKVDQTPVNHFLFFHCEHFIGYK